MRAFAGLLVAALLFCGIYYCYVQRLPSTDTGTTATQAISLIGVRTDLMQIARAERNYLAQNGRCISLDDLLSSGSLNMTRPERDGYTYSVDCAGAGFTASAHHAPAPAGSPVRYPNLAIDQTMQVHELP